METNAIITVFLVAVVLGTFFVGYILNIVKLVKCMRRRAVFSVFLRFLGVIMPLFGAMLGWV